MIHDLWLWIFKFRGKWEIFTIILTYNFCQVCEAYWLSCYFFIVDVVGVDMFTFNKMSKFLIWRTGGECAPAPIAGSLWPNFNKSINHIKWKLMTSRMNFLIEEFSVILLFLNYRAFYKNFYLVFVSLCCTFKKMFKFFIWSVTLIIYISNESLWPPELMFQDRNFL